MLRLHHAPMARSLRILWLLEEMGLEYEIVDAETGYQQDPAFLARNPLGLLPVLEDGDTNVFESAAIVEYLLETYGDHGLRPKTGTPEWVRYLTWMNAAETAVQPLGGYLEHTLNLPGFEAAGGVMRPEIAADHRAKHERYLSGLELALEGRDFIAGNEFSAADVMLSYLVVGARMFDLLDADRFPNTAAYATRLTERPAAKKVLGGS